MKLWNKNDTFNFWMIFDHSDISKELLGGTPHDSIIIQAALSQAGTGSTGCSGRAQYPVVYVLLYFWQISQIFSNLLVARTSLGYCLLLHMAYYICTT